MATLGAIIIVVGFYIIYRNSKVVKTTYYLPQHMMSEHADVTDTLRRDRKSDTVWFPNSKRPEQHYYLTGIEFSPEYVKREGTIKGKPAKRGHYVRNTIFFGLIGTAATHDRAATPDKHYTYNVEKPGYGYLYLIDTDLRHSFKVEFKSTSYKADLLKKFVTRNKEIRDIEL